jgi:carbamate kinase
VVEGPGGLRGVPAVVDKDRVSALLARDVGATRLLFATGVPSLFRGFGGPDARPLARLDAAEAERLLAAGEFPPGSMGPKVEAALAFLRHGGRRVAITSPPHLQAALRGEAGTEIVS